MEEAAGTKEVHRSTGMAGKMEEAAGTKEVHRTTGMEEAAGTKKVHRSTEMAAQMEEVWKQLPEELQLKLVDDHLPLQSQCRFRSVSKAWEAPRLKRGALHGLYIRKNRDIDSALFLYNKKIGKSYNLLRKGSSMFKYADCVNGLFGALFGGGPHNRAMKNQVRFSVFNVFSPGWTHLPLPPPAPGRACLFGGLSKKLGEPPRIGMSNLEDYIFMVAMGNQVKGEVPATSLVLQVYSAGEWSSALLELPPGHSFMYCKTGIQWRCGVFRGSDFFFLTMHSNETAVSLCCVDVLAEHKACKVLCGLSREFVTDWKFSSWNHPKLALCSGKILLLHRKELAGGELTFGVEMLEEEKRRWRLISSLPLDVKALSAPDPAFFYPHRISCGGEELVIYDGRATGYMYNVVTGACLFPIAYQP